MKFKKLVVLVVVLFLIGVVSLFKKANLEKEKAQSNVKTISQNELSLGRDLASNLVTQIELRRGLPAQKPDASSADRLILKKNPSETWVLDDHYGTHVRKESVEMLLKLLGALRGEVRAENPAVFGDFSLTDEKAIHILISGAAGKELGHFLVSPLRPRGTQNFVRTANAGKVIATDSDVLASLGIFSKEDKLNYRTFADLRVAGIDSAKVNSFEWTPSGAKTLTFTKKEDPKDKSVSWLLADEPAAEVDTAKVNEFLSSIYNLYASDSLDPAAHSKDFSGSAPWLRVHLKAGEKPDTVEIWTGPRSEEKKTALLRAMPDALVYELAGSQLDPLLKKNKESFLKSKGG